MKKLILLPLLIFVMAFAEDTEQAKRVKTMQNLVEALNTIQNGIMTNDRNTVKEGVDKMKENTNDINSFDIKNENGVSFKAKKYSMEEALLINSLSEEILSAFEKGKRNRLLDTYRRLQNRCLTCHALIRKW